MWWQREACILSGNSPPGEPSGSSQWAEPFKFVNKSGFCPFDQTCRWIQRDVLTFLNKQTNKQTHVTLMVREAGTEKTTTRGWRVGDAYFIWFTVACRELGHGPHVPNESVSLREGLENCTLVILGYWLFGKQGIKKKEMGVPAVAQQKWIWLVSMRMQIQSLALLSELRTQLIAMSCDVGHRPS